MSDKFLVTPSPHFLGHNSTRSIMLDVVIALCPALIAAVVLFGYRSAVITAVCVVSAIISEWLSRKVMKKPQTIGDLSAVVTGMLLAFNLPLSIPYWIAALGSVIAIVAVKQMFGGIGHNFANPAIVARIVLLVSFPVRMTDYSAPIFSIGGLDARTSATLLTSATPLTAIKEGAGSMPSTLEMLLGFKGGCIGEVCALALILGGVYLVARKVITPVIPLTFIGTVFILSFVAGRDPVTSILTGGLMLGAIFMATDYSTSPMSTAGKVIFAVGCGAITVVIRRFGSLPEGVSYSILLMNILTPHIDRLTMNRPFGTEKKGRSKA